MASRIGTNFLGTAIFRLAPQLRSNVFRYYGSKNSSVAVKATSGSHNGGNAIYAGAFVISLPFCYLSIYIYIYIYINAFYIYIYIYCISYICLYIYIYIYIYIFIIIASNGINLIGGVICGILSVFVKI